MSLFSFQYHRKKTELELECNKIINIYSRHKNICLNSPNFSAYFCRPNESEENKSEGKNAFHFPWARKNYDGNRKLHFFFIFFKIISRDKNHVWDKFLFRLITANDVIAADGYEMNFSPQSSFFYLRRIFVTQ